MLDEIVARRSKFGPPPQAPMPRFLARVEKTDTCWLWLAFRDKKGYGKFWPRHGLLVQAHRWIYEQLCGPIPTGFQIDHLCRVRNCVNPEHLEAVTPQENVRRVEWKRNPNPCCRCGRKPVYARDLCSPCYQAVNRRRPTPTQQARRLEQARARTVYDACACGARKLATSPRCAQCGRVVGGRTLTRRVAEQRILQMAQTWREPAAAEAE